MVGRGTERSLGSLITVQTELLYHDGQSVNTGFHNGVFTWRHQQLGFYFPLNVHEGARLPGGQGCFLLQQANHVLSPWQTIDGSKNTPSESWWPPQPKPQPGAAVTKGTCCSSVALIPGSRNEIAHGNASLRFLTAGHFTLLEGCRLSMGRVQAWAW